MHAMPDVGLRRTNVLLSPALPSTTPTKPSTVHAKPSQADIMLSQSNHLFVHDATIRWGKKVSIHQKTSYERVNTHLTQLCVMGRLSYVARCHCT